LALPIASAYLLPHTGFRGFAGANEFVTLLYA
jgi:hypothetical protein